MARILAILLVEALLIVVEIIMLLSGLGETPIGIVLGLIPSVLGLLLINIEVAYVDFIYRVASVPTGEEVGLSSIHGTVGGSVMVIE